MWRIFFVAVICGIIGMILAYNLDSYIDPEFFKQTIDKLTVRELCYLLGIFTLINIIFSGGK